MCTFACYLGEKKAAPVLLDMSMKQEGIWSGYYTGLATLAEGKFHWNKIVGDTQKLEGEAGVSSFPGTIGLIHSRTRGGGGKEWAQPFLDLSETVVCAAQGSAGLFKSDSERIRLADELLEKGYIFRTAVPGKMGEYPFLPNKTSVHTTEIASLAVAEAYGRGKDPVEAIRCVISRISSEAIYAFIFRDEPKRVFVSNVNQRMAIGADSSGIYLATSALTFPDNINWRAEIPSNTIAEIGQNAVKFHVIARQDKMRVLESFPAKMDESFLDYVRSHPGTTLAAVVDEALAPLFPKGKLVRKAAAGYQTMERLVEAGQIIYETQMVPGVEADGRAPQTVFAPGESQ